MPRPKTRQAAPLQKEHAASALPPCEATCIRLNFCSRAGRSSFQIAPSEGHEAMINRASLWAFLLLFLSCAASAQLFTIPQSPASALTNSAPLDLVQATVMDFNLWQINTRSGGSSPLATPGGSVSKLDLKAPGKAQRAYEKGYQLMMRKDLQGAVQHLTTATLIYPSFVAAHNALGSAYLGLGQNEQAR